MLDKWYCFDDKHRRVKYFSFLSWKGLYLISGVLSPAGFFFSSFYLRHGIFIDNRKQQKTQLSARHDRNWVVSVYHEYGVLHSSCSARANVAPHKS